MVTVGSEDYFKIAQFGGTEHLEALHDRLTGMFGAWSQRRVIPLRDTVAKEIRSRTDRFEADDCEAYLYFERDPHLPVFYKVNVLVKGEGALRSELVDKVDQVYLHHGFR